MGLTVRKSVKAATGRPFSYGVIFANQTAYVVREWVDSPLFRCMLFKMASRREFVVLPLDTAWVTIIDEPGRNCPSLRLPAFPLVS